MSRPIKVGVKTQNIGQMGLGKHRLLLVPFSLFNSCLDVVMYVVLKFLQILFALCLEK